jgi:hypothetical protein
VLQKPEKVVDVFLTNTLAANGQGSPPPKKKK